MDAPRDSLIRANFEHRATEVEGRTMVGYPIVFDTWTTINSWEGQFKERIAPSALNKTLAENRDAVKVLFNHGMDPSIGDKPLGRPTVMRADSTGLYAEVVLSETSYNDDLLALMRDGVLNGQSFRFSVVKEDWHTPKRGLPERTVTELKLFEFGPVTFPAYAAASVGIRSREKFAEWMSLSEDRRLMVDAIFRADPDQLITLNIATDLSTLNDEAGTDHSDDESRDETEDLEPQVQHSSDHLSRDAADAAIAKLKELSQWR